MKNVETNNLGDKHLGDSKKPGWIYQELIISNQGQFFSVATSERVCPAWSIWVQSQWQTVACPVGGYEDDEVMEQVV